MRLRFNNGYLHIFILLTFSSCSSSDFVGGEEGKQPDLYEMDVGEVKKHGKSSDAIGDEKDLENKETLNEVFGGGVKSRKELCNSDAKKRTTEMVAFEAVSHCPWNQNGNGGRESGGHSIDARIRQTKSIDLSQYGELCNISLKSTKTTPFRYDDTIHFLLADYLISGYGWSGDTLIQKGMAVNDGIITWDFSKIKLNTYSGQQYCAEGLTCILPNTQVAGQIEFVIPSEWIDKIESKIDLSNKIDLSIVIGGNDESDDCNHNGVTFEAEIFYIESP